jgi:hypothetical protein
VKDCAKTALRNECLKLLLAVSALATPAISPETTEEQSAKCRLIYWRLLDIVFKIDHIDTASSGADFISLLDLGADHKLANKYHVISSALWVSPTPQDKRDWSSVVEAIERDIVAIGNHYKFKRLIDHVADATKAQSGGV